MEFYIRISYKKHNQSQAMSFSSEGAVHAGNKGYSRIRVSGAIGPPVILERHSLSRK